MDLTKLKFGNGGGSIKSIEQVARACKGAMTRIIVGSITLEPRIGNTGETYYFHPQDYWSLNSLGLPNRGMNVYKELLPLMVKMAHNTSTLERKELWANIAGFSPAEYAEMAAACFAAGVDGVELNLSCPNVWSGNTHAEMPALNPTLAWEVLSAVGAKVGAERHIAVKLSPNAGPGLLQQLADMIKASKIVEQVTACNTIPNERGKRVDGKEALAFRSNENDPDLKHVGGLAGSACLKSNVKVVEYLRPMLPPRIGITGSGGIFNGADAHLHLKAGANSFQCTTSYIEHREQVFVDILMLLDDLLENKS